MCSNSCKFVVFLIGWGVLLSFAGSLAYRKLSCHVPWCLDYLLLMTGLAVIAFKIVMTACVVVGWFRMRDWRMIHIELRSRLFGIGYNLLFWLVGVYAVTLLWDKVLRCIWKCWGDYFVNAYKLLSGYFGQVPLTCAWICLCIGFGLIGLLIYHFWSHQRKPKTRDEDLGVLRDDPCQSQKDDVLGREPYVGMLASLVMDGSKQKSARFVGIYAPWGEGKTSVRNFLEERIVKEYGQGAAMFVDFSPWGYPRDFDLAFALFDRLGKSFRRIGMGAASSLIRNYARILSLRRDSANASSIHKVLELACKFWIRLVDEDRVKKDLEYVLSRSLVRVIVVIDDLERMPADEVCRVVRFLKANGNLPGLVYLILSDERYLELSVSKMIVCAGQSCQQEGREYLKKIVPIRCPLPRVSRSALTAELLRGLSVLKRQVGVVSTDSDESVTFLLGKLGNVREIKKFLNAMLVQLHVFKRHGHFNVNFEDLMVLTLVKEVDSGLYDCLWNVYWKVFGDSIGIDAKGTPAAWIEKHYLSKVGAFDKEELLDFLSKRMGIEADQSHDGHECNYVTVKATRPELMYGYRLASSYCFANYFLTSIENNYLEQSDLRGVLSSVENGEFPAAIITRLDGELRLSILMFVLEAQAVWTEREKTEHYIDFLLQLCRMNLTISQIPPEFVRYELFGDMTIYNRVFRCLSFYCKRVHEQILSGVIRWDGVSAIGDVLWNRVTSGGNLYVMSEFLGFDAGNQDKNVRGAFFSADQYRKLEDCYLEQIIEYQASGQLLAHIQFFTMYRAWLILLSQRKDHKLIEQFRTAMKPSLADPLSVKKLLWTFVNEEMDFSPYVSRIVTFNVARFVECFDFDAIGMALAVLESFPDLDEFWLHTVILLRWIIGRDPDDNCDSAAQIKYLKEYCQTDSYKRDRKKYCSKK